MYKSRAYRLLGFLMAVMITGMLTGCGGKTAEGQSDPIPDTPLAEDGDFTQVVFPSTNDTEGMSAMLVYVGESLAEMYQSEETGYVVIADVVLDTGIIDHEKTPDQVVSVLRLREVLKGDMQPGDLIRVPETGIRRLDGSDVAIDGVPLLRKNMRVLLFLKPPYTMKNGETGYSIRGVYQGKFFFDTEGMLHAGASLSDEAHQQLEDCPDVMTLEEFKALLPLETAD